MKLIDRIAECREDSVPSQVNVYLKQGSNGRRQELQATTLFCSLPRNTRELDVAWKILPRAYTNLCGPSAEVAGAQIVSTWDYPMFSRTTLQ